MKKLNQQEKCKEQWKTIPYSSEHLWQGDIHGIPSGNCTKCGMAYWDYDQRFNKKVMTKGFMKKYLKLCQPSVVEKCKEKSMNKLLNKDNKNLIYGKKSASPTPTTNPIGSSLVDKSEKHKIGEHGAIGFVVRRGNKIIRKCAECNEDIEEPALLKAIKFSLSKKGKKIIQDYATNYARTGTCPLHICKNCSEVFNPEAQRHDNEILVNTLIQTKKTEVVIAYAKGHIKGREKERKEIKTNFDPYDRGGMNNKLK